MVDMTINKSDKSNYIIDITNMGSYINIKYADGKEENDELMSEHNYNVYRRRMINQIKEYSNKYMNKLSWESFKIFLHRYVPIVLSLIGLYFGYNFDIHIIFKILLTIVLLVINGLNLLVNEIWTIVMSEDLDKVEAYMYYEKNIKNFMKDEINDEYLLPIEDIDKCNLTYNMVVEIGKTVEKFRTDHPDDDVELSLNYKKKEVKNG